VLQNVILAGGALTATDLELQIAADIEYHGDPLLLPHGRLLQILRETRADEVTLTVDGSACVVAAGRGTWRLPLGDPAEWPRWEAVNAKPLIRLPADQFARAVRGTVYATDNESSRFALGAVLVEVSGAVCSFVATDGRRLSLVQCEHDQSVDDATALVPAHALQSMRIIAEQNKNESVQLEATSSELVASMPGYTVLARQIQGRFPPWRDVIPDRDGVSETVVARGDLMAATSAAKIVTSEQSKGVEFTFSESGVTLHGQSSEYGTSDVTIDVVSGGEPVKVKLDPEFVIAWLKGLTSEDDPNVTLELVDPQSACILRSGEDCTGVIMPMAAD
jgi:DNA polymerase-3 subunit beta